MRAEQHIVGVSLTVLLHLGLALAVVVQGECGWLSESKADTGSKFKDARIIEAGLARKAVEKKSKQPQKKKKLKFKPPEGVKVARDKAVVKEDDDKKKMRPEPDEVDISSILDKNRVQEPDLSSHGSDEVPVEGSKDGSEWGTLKEAKGDPYVGELYGRISSVWAVPTLEKEAGRVEGCVRLDESGKIVDSEIRKRSSNANLNRSVKLALKKAPSMEKPVPSHLKELLTVTGICFPFEIEAQ